MTKHPPLNAIHFILTGGTIDSHYDGSKDTAVPNDKSVVPEFIQSLKLYRKSRFTTVCMKDSRSLNRIDLNNVLRTIEKSSSKSIIVTHGTYTMPDTARFLEANLKRRDQIVILTASAIPIMGFSPSDGPFNLGFAMAKAEHLPAGVYVIMNGRVFTPKEVMKVLSEARFASIFQK
jgi:L-asparaginase